MPSHRAPSHSASPSSPPAPMCYTAGGGGDGARMLNKRDPPPCIPSPFLPVLLSTLPSLLYRRVRAMARACSTSGKRRAFSASANASTAAASDRRWCQTHRPRAGSIETCAFCNIHRLPNIENTHSRRKHLYFCVTPSLPAVCQTHRPTSRPRAEKKGLSLSCLFRFPITF